MQVGNEKLKSIIERIESLERQKDDFAEDIREVYTEAGSQGFDKKALRQVIKLRKMDADKRSELEQLVDLYMGAVS